MIIDSYIHNYNAFIHLLPFVFINNGFYSNYLRKSS